MNNEIAIDNIKSLIQREQASSGEMKLMAGDGIGVAKSGNGYIVSSVSTEDDPSGVYTLDICVDGVPKKLTVFVTGQPY
jgi:hypothetical protein